MTAVGQGKVGKDGKRLPMTIKKNDIVMFGKYAGSDVEVGGKEFKIMRENEVLLRQEYHIQHYLHLLNNLNPTDRLNHT